MSYAQAIEKHPDKTSIIIKKMDSISEDIITMVEQHHESYNGKGYPKKLRGNEIHKFSRILTIANFNF